MISMWWIIWVFNISRFVKFQTAAAITVIYEGGTVTLTCTESPTFYPGWNGPDVDPYNYITQSVFANPALGEKASRLSWDPTNNKSLVINNVMKNDTGTYKCTYNMNNEHKSRMHDLYVRVLPLAPVISNTETLDGTTTVVRGTEGQELTLKCTSTGGYPEPLLDWYKDSTQTQPLDITKTSQEGSDGTYTVVVTHTFTPSNQDDDVTFVCQSSYSPPQPSKKRVQVQLLLILKPSQPVITSYPVVEGVSGKVADCRTSGFRPDNIDVWFQMNGNNVTSNTAITGNTGQTFSAVASYTAALQRQQNGKPLVCYVAHQTIQTPLIGSGTVDVRFRSLAAALTGSVSNIVADNNAKITLTCTSGTSNPKSTITWHRGGVQITNQAAVTETNGDFNGVVTSQILEFAPTRSIDGQRVYCTVHNSIEGQPPVRSETKTLDLLFHPIVKVTGDTEIIEGQHVTLKCDADAKPNPTFTWYLNGNPIHVDSSNDGNMSELVIEAANRTHHGQYTCKAANGFAPNGTAHTNVTIKYAPDVVVSSSNVTVNDTEAELICTPFGVPDTYTYSAWEHIWPGYGVLPHSGLGNRPILKLSSLSYEYSGIYRCSASNGVTGSLNPNAGFGETYLQVKSPPETPYSVLIEDVQSSSVTISWLPGFHGGFDQTFTIEYSNKAGEWLQVNIPGDQHRNRFNKTTRGLQTGTRYFFRIKSVNERGTSDYSNTLNATTKVIDGSLHQIPAANAAFRDNGSTGVQHDGMVCDYYNMNREMYESLEYAQGHGHEYDVLGQRPLYEDLSYTNDSSHQYGTLDNVKEDQPVSKDGKMYENLRLSPLK